MTAYSVGRRGRVYLGYFVTPAHNVSTVSSVELLFSAYVIASTSVNRSQYNELIY